MIIELATDTLGYCKQCGAEVVVSEGNYIAAENAGNYAVVQCCGQRCENNEPQEYQPEKPFWQEKTPDD